MALVLIAGLAGVWFLLAQSGRAGASEDTLLIKSGAASHAFTIELVDTDETRAQGLMNRQYLAPDAGMLFDFHTERPVSFWMMNTFIPLDMLFIRANGEIARIHANAIPHDRTPIPSGGPVRFVLEIPGGRAAELSIVEGDTVEHPRITAQ